MQDSETMAYMMKDMIQYIMQPKIRSAPDSSTYVSYDIAAYDSFTRDIVAIVWDAAPRASHRHIQVRLPDRQVEALKSISTGTTPAGM